MGYGDELMALGAARHAMARDPRRVAILDRNGVRRWHPLWSGNKRIAKPQERGNFQGIVNGPRCRPYIDYEAMRARWGQANPSESWDIKRRDPQQPWIWRPFAATPAELRLPPKADPTRARAVVLEPSCKDRASPNKDWGFDRWQQLAYAIWHRLKVPVIQVSPPGSRRLANVETIKTESFLDAAQVLGTVAAAVLPEGGLHHLAAAVSTPSVVIYGGFISPAQTGYGLHHNLYAGGEPCGMRTPCSHCKDAMASITIGMILERLEQILETGRGRLDS